MDNAFDDPFNFNYDLLKYLTNISIENFDLTLSDGDKSHTFNDLVRSSCVTNYRQLVKKKKILGINDILTIIK